MHFVGQNAEFLNVKTGGIHSLHSYHCTAKGVSRIEVSALDIHLNLL